MFRKFLVRVKDRNDPIQVYLSLHTYHIYLINVVADYRLSSLVIKRSPFYREFVSQVKYFGVRFVDVRALIYTFFFVHFQSRFCDRYESFESRKDVRARIMGRLSFFFLFFFCRCRPITNRLTKKLMKIQNNQSLGILLKSLYFLSP